MPDYEFEQTKCSNFLKNFRSSNPNSASSLKYFQQIKEIAHRKQTVLCIELDDLYAAGDQDLVENIERNALRYIGIFAEAIDPLVASEAPAIPLLTEDVYDVLLMHRTQRLQSQDQDQDRLEMDIDAQPYSPTQVANGLPLADNTAAEKEGEKEKPKTKPKPKLNPENFNNIPKSLLRRYELRILPRTDQSRIKLREVRSKQIGSLVNVKGIVTRISEVKPLLIVATYTCDRCGYEVYQEIASKTFLPINDCPSVVCKANRTKGKLQMQTRGSKYIKFQDFRLQETAEEVPIGHTPRTLWVHCRGDLTRQCSPGDVVSVSGIFLPSPQTAFRSRSSSNNSETYVEAMHILQHKKNYSDFVLTPQLDQQVDSFVSEGNVYERLARSLAPEIYGHEDIKKALILMMVSGLGKELHDGMKIRGDINVCLVGDPGVAKSQLLKHISLISPRGIYTSGKGSSGVGLTAAVIRDPLTHEMTLEGGSLVLADMGVCCIDEFDKMDDGDRTSIHEVMEQQTISIAKAGITTTLNARTSILAAANPAYGRYNSHKSPSENINLPAALLSRFDLLFVLLDRPTFESDLAMAKHVTHVHRFSKPPPVATASVVSSDLLRSIVAKAKRVAPYIPDEQTMTYVVDQYVNMRKTEASTVDPNTYTTARTLLAIMRLSHAHARLRFSEHVGSEDVDEAIRLMIMSKSSIEDERNKRRGGNDPTSAIYLVVKEMLRSTSSNSVKRSDVEPKVYAKGFTLDQFNKCLDAYEKLDVWRISSDQTMITMIAK